MQRIPVANMRHDPRASTWAERLTPAARRRWDYWGAVVESVSASWGGPHDRSTAMPCRRRPGHTACPGFLTVTLNDGAVFWQCPRCGDAGYIRGWEGCAHDLSGVEVPGLHGDEWLATIVTPQEMRACVGPGLGLPVGVLRCLRAASATRPGPRIQAPAPMWDALIMEIAERALMRPSTPRRRRLRSVWLRLVDATREW